MWLRPSAAAPAAGILMQGTKGQPSPRQGSIDLQNREGQHGTGARGSAFKLTNALAKLGKHGIEGMVGHGRFVAPSGFSAVL